MIQAAIQTTGGSSTAENLRHLMLPAVHAPSTFLGYPDFISWLHDWLPIILMALLVIAVFSLMRFMPRILPAFCVAAALLLCVKLVAIAMALNTPAVAETAKPARPTQPSPRTGSE